VVYDQTQLSQMKLGKNEKLLGLFSDLELVASLNSVEEAVGWFQENEHPQLIFFGYCFR
jgi:alkaline phosphatase